MEAHPPKELRPSRRGLFDQHGNLYEWTHDLFADYGDEWSIDPLGSEVGSPRVSRGGCWIDAAEYCRNAYRAPLVPSFRYSYRGFRLALSLPGFSGPEQGHGAESADKGTDGEGLGDSLTG